MGLNELRDVNAILELIGLDAVLWAEQQIMAAKWHPLSPWSEMVIHKIAKKHGATHLTEQLGGEPE